MRIPLLEVTCVADHDAYVCFVAGKLRADGVLACWSHAFECESDWASRYLREEIIGACQCNIVISGGTGSGKTTLLNCLTGFIHPDERIITCEDAAELQLQQPHVVRLETRPPNLEGKGKITDYFAQKSDGKPIEIFA